MNSQSKTSLHSSSQHSSNENNDNKKAMKRTNSIVNSPTNINDVSANLSSESKPVFSKSLANKIANARAKLANSNNSSVNNVNNSETYQNVSNVVKPVNQIQQANSKKNSLSNSTNLPSQNPQQQSQPTSNQNGNHSNINNTKPNSVAQNEVSKPIKQSTPVNKSDHLNGTTKAIKTTNVKINSNKKI